MLKRSIIRNAAFITLLFPCFALCTGCITLSWNDKIKSHLVQNVSDKQAPCVGFEPYGLNGKCVHPSYTKCTYIGLAGQDSVNYHHYICPNMYNDSTDAFLDIYIPYLETGREVAIIKSIDRKNIPHIPIQSERPVYIQFSSIATINPKFVQSTDQSGPTNPFSTNYPSLISVGFDGVEGTLRAGQRIDVKKLSKEDLKRFGIKGRNYLSVCPETKAYIDSMPPYVYNQEVTYDIRSDCDLWYWSDTMVVVGYIKGNNKLPWKVLKYTGYLVTVPLDVLTSPIQLPAWIAFLSSDWSMK